MGHQKCGPKGHEVIEVEGTWKSLIPYWSEEILESRCLQNAIFCGPFSTSNPANRVFFQQGATR
jgi:hypothetical protein